MTAPRWTVTVAATPEPVAYEIEGMPDFGDLWVTFMHRVGPETKHVVAMFPLRHLLSITSHTYVSEDQR